MNLINLNKTYIIKYISTLDYFSLINLYIYTTCIYKSYFSIKYIPHNTITL